MPKKLTQKQFLEKANTVHKNKYDYSLVNYVNNSTKITIICPIHGSFLQKPSGHLQSQGCQKCGWVKQTLNTRSNTKDFITKSKEVHNNKYIYDKVNYINNSIPVTIICPIHKEFEQSPSKHKMGQGCPICRYIKSGKSNRKSNEYFIDTLKIKGIFDKFIYLSEYETSNKKIKIQCRKCNLIFNQKPTAHLQGMGCPKCAGINRTIEDFIEKGRKIHGDKYDYSLLENKFTKESQKIICPKHGEFEQVMSYHLFGAGCKKCAREKISERNKENPVGWTYQIWTKAGERSKIFDNFKVYIIRCWNENEEFYKIGKTFGTVKNRFKNSFPYNYEVIKEIIGSGLNVSKLEHKLQKENKQYKYLPQKKFAGMYECFSNLNFELLESTQA